MNSVEACQLPPSDLRWLNFVKRYDRLSANYEQFYPLRRAVYEAIYHGHAAQMRGPLWRTFLRYLKHGILRRWNDRLLKEADAILWLDIDRDHMYQIVRVLRTLLHENRISSIVLTRPKLKGHRLAGSPVRVYPKPAQPLPAEAREFVRLISDEFSSEKRAHLEQRLNRILADYYVYQERFQSLVDRIKPKMVLCTYDQYPLAATLTKVARQNSIRTYVLQHGAANPIQYPLQADKFLVWGEEDREYYERLGMPKGSVVVTGSIFHDTFLFHRNERDTKNKVLLLSNGNDDERNLSLPSVAYDWFKALKSADNRRYHCYVRYHPREKEEYKALAGDFDLSLNHLPLYDALKASDIVVGYVSTALLESSLVGRPVIQIVERNNQGLCNYWKNGVAIGVQDYREFKAQVDSLSQNNERYDRVVEVQRRAIQLYFHNYPNARGAFLRTLEL